MLNEACRQNKAWQDAGLPPVRVCVNVSAKQFKDRSLRRQDFAERLAKFFYDLEQGAQAAEAKAVLEDVRERLSVASGVTDSDRAAVVLLEIEQQARTAMRNLVQACTITKPRGLGLSRALQSDWNAYVKNIDKLASEIFGPVSGEILSSLALLEISTASTNEGAWLLVWRQRSKMPQAMRLGCDGKYKTG